MTASDRGAQGGWLWRPLVGAGMSQVVLGIARPTLSYAALDAGADGFGVGVVAAFFAIVPMFLAVPVGVLAGRLWRIGAVPLVGGIVMAAGATAAAAASGIELLLLASVLLGVGNLAVLIGAQSWISRSAPASRYASGFGWMTAAMALGQSVGPAIAGTVLGAGAEEGGIRVAFVVAAGVAVAGAFVFATGASRDVRAGDDDTRLPVRAILRVRGVARYVVISASVLAAVDIVTAYLPLLGEAAGIPPTTVGLLLAVRGAFSTLSRIGLGRLSARLPVHVLVAVSAAGSAVCLLLVALFPTPVTLLPVLAVGGFLLGVGQPVTMTAVAIALAPASRSTGLALRLLGNRVAQTVTPLFAGGLAGLWGVEAVFVMQAAGLLTCGVWEAVTARRGG